MMHPAAVNALKVMIDGFMKGEKPSEPNDWVSITVGGN
jgi:hypothetical protein